MTKVRITTPKRALSFMHHRCENRTIKQQHVFQPWKAVLQSSACLPGLNRYGGCKILEQTKIVPTKVVGWSIRGTMSQMAFTQPPQNIRSQPRKLGLNSEELEQNGRLGIWNWNTIQL